MQKCTCGTFASDGGADGSQGEDSSAATDEAAARDVMVRYYIDAGMSPSTADCTADRMAAIEQSGGSDLEYGQIMFDCDLTLDDIDAPRTSDDQDDGTRSSQRVRGTARAYR